MQNSQYGICIESSSSVYPPNPLYAYTYMSIYIYTHIMPIYTEICNSQHPYIYIYALIYIYLHDYHPLGNLDRPHQVNDHIYIHTHIQIHLYTITYKCRYKYTYTYKYKDTYAYKYMYTYIYIPS
jgi:hypothetical protein